MDSTNTVSLGELVQGLPLPETAWHDRRLAAGEVLFRSGEPGDTFYVVADGELEVFVEDKGAAHITIARLGPGDYLGELALLDGGARTASAAAMVPTRLRALSRDAFLGQLESSPVLAGALVSPLSERLRSVLGYLEHLIGWARQAAEGKYGEAQAAIESQVRASSGDAARFYESFAEMLDAVQQREAALQRELSELRIQIDTVKHQQEVAKITETPAFQDIAEAARRMRDRYRSVGGA